jgi:hypothetical protein
MRYYSIILSISILLCLSAVAFGQGDWYVAPSEGKGFGKFQQWTKSFGSNTEALLVGDVTGDGRADAVTMNNQTGEWKVAESKGKSFNKGKARITNYAVYSTTQFLGDVNGDGKDDAVSFYPDKGDWYVAVSRGGGKFEKHTLWLTGHGIGSQKQFLGDVDGDKRADAVIFFEREGIWFTSLSEGNNFSTRNISYQNSWIKGHGIGSSNQMLGDVTGDGKADAIVYFGQFGRWYVSPSSGSNFQNFNQWIDGHGKESNAQLLGDVDGDDRADAIVFFDKFGSWYSALSRANSFDTFSQWADGHGIGSTKQFLADVTGDGKDDAIVVFAK